MLAKLFLLAVVCVSFVQVRGNEASGLRMKAGEESLRDFLKGEFLSRHLRNASKEQLEKKIKEAIDIVNDIRDVGLGLLKREWTARNDFRLTVAKNATESWEKAREDEAKLQKILHRMADNIREEAMMSNKPSAVFHCISKTEENARKQVTTLMKEMVTAVLCLNAEFNNEFPEYSFLIVEAMVTGMWKSVIESIKDKEDLEGVQEQVEFAGQQMFQRLSSLRENTGSASEAFLGHQLGINVAYRATRRQTEQLMAATFSNLRKCLDERAVSLEKILRGNILK